MTQIALDPVCFWNTNCTNQDVFYVHKQHHIKRRESEEFMIRVFSVQPSTKFTFQYTHTLHSLSSRERKKKSFLNSRNNYRPRNSNEQTSLDGSTP
jgi:hypothetical protein